MNWLFSLLLAVVIFFLVRCIAESMDAEDPPRDGEFKHGSTCFGLLVALYAFAYGMINFGED